MTILILIKLVWCGKYYSQLVYGFTDTNCFTFWQFIIKKVKLFGFNIHPTRSHTRPILVEMLLTLLH